MNLTPHGDVIDAIAREMTLEDPSGALRARVLAKLPPRHSPRGLRLALPLGSAALVLVWMLGPTAPIRPDSASQQEVAQLDNHLQTSSAAGPAEPRTKSAQRISSHAAMSEEELAWHSRAVAPLPAFAPIELPAIQPAALSIAPISVDPIVTDPMPLKAPDAPHGGR